LISVFQWCERVSFALRSYGSSGNLAHSYHFSHGHCLTGKRVLLSEINGEPTDFSALNRMWHMYRTSEQCFMKTRD